MSRPLDRPLDRPRDRPRDRRADLVLAAAALGALNTVNAWRPFFRRGSLSPLSFFAGWPTSELPLQALVDQAAVVAATASIWRRMPARRQAAALGLTAASWAGLAALQAPARRADSICDEALAQAFGPDYRDRVVHPAWLETPPGVPRRPGALRTMAVRRRFAHDKDIAYGPAGKANLLDIWHRDDLTTTAKAPVLLQVPGGAWITGNKQAQAYPLMSHLAERGWVCVAMSYRLSPRATWPDAIVDVKHALAWVKEHIAEFGGDPDFVAITGGSAGGHLSSLAALTPNDPAFQPGFEDADTSVRAAVPFYGVYDWVDDQRTGHRGLPRLLERLVVKKPLHDAPEVYAAASPIRRVTADAPPTFLLHGTADSLVPVEQARAFAAALRETSRAPVAYAELPFAQHAFDFFGSIRSAASAVAVERFLGVVYGDYCRS
jgi:acetyl esterase/lipase